MNGDRLNTDNTGIIETEGGSIQPPAISLPKGGGAIKGIDEKLTVNPSTGTASVSVPIFTSPGRSDFHPKLSLSYDSGAGNGPFGFGWNLLLPSITRKTDKGIPKYIDGEESDVFILSGAEDLVPVLEVNDSDGQWVPLDVPPRTIGDQTYNIHRYRPRIEGLFARIERWTNTSDIGDTFWRSISKDNITTWYGKTDKSRISDPADPTRIFSWLICETYDDKGNAIVYEYEEENSADIDTSQAHEKNRTHISRSTNRYLKRIHYGNRESRLVQPDLSQAEWMFEVVFDYDDGHYEELPFDVSTPAVEQHRYVRANINGAQNVDGRMWTSRQDPFSLYRAGFEIRTYRLCRRVLMFHHFPDELGTADYLVRSTEFTYEQGPIASFMVGAIQSGYTRESDDRYLKKSLPPLEFSFSKAEIDPTIRQIDSDNVENLPVGLDGSQYLWVDLDGEGISGVLTEQSGGWYYKRNLGNAEFAPIQKIVSQPSMGNLSGGQQQFVDLAGDGNLDLALLSSEISGYYERDDSEGWNGGFKPFKSRPNVNFQDINLRLVDLNGDGHADILITENEVFVWYPSLAEEGFGPAGLVRKPIDEETGPALVFADGTQTIFLADMSGDGLQDFVRIRNGEVAYWPNLGYARFGAKVTMDDSPFFDAPDLFDPTRIRLADIDGSGNSDIIYLYYDQVRIWRNRSGNSWDPPEQLTTPPIDNLSDIAVTDLLGNGTACLVWSSPLPKNAANPMRFIDLMSSRKPHLMVATRNNMGAETRVHYATSTKFYLKDRQSGKPWITRLPFPVHVVERMETFDHISNNRFVTRYAYHHGYFDGIEREFRGFAMVEQWDTEEYETLAGSAEFAAASNIDEASHVPPVLTRTWFHTGAYIGREKISRQLAHEYYGAPESDQANYAAAFQIFQESLLPDTILPPNSISSRTNGKPAARLRDPSCVRKFTVWIFQKKAQSPTAYRSATTRLNIFSRQAETAMRFSLSIRARPSTTSMSETRMTRALRIP